MRTATDGRDMSFPLPGLNFHGLGVGGRAMPRHGNSDAGGSMGNAEYDAYLLTDMWRAKRLRRLTTDGKRCQGCGSTAKLHVHHRTYDRFGGRERMSDLITVCEICHTLIHQAHRGQRKDSLDVVTGRVLARLRRQRAAQARGKKAPTTTRKKLARAKYIAPKTRPGWERDSDPTWTGKAVHWAAADLSDIRRRNGL